jgi:hypothetical protein
MGAGRFDRLRPSLSRGQDTMISAQLSVCVLMLGVAAAPLELLSAQASGGATNTMKVTIGSGPDRGIHTIELGARNPDGQASCSVLSRADRQPGSYVNGHFYPELNNKPGLMEAVTAFNVGTNGSTTEASFAVTFIAGTGANMTLRAYEAESRPTRPAKGKVVSATFARTGATATARVEGETAEGVTITMEMTCRAVTDRMP